MKKYLPDMLFTLAQLALLLFIGAFRSSEIFFPLIILLAVISVLSPFVCRRSDASFVEEPGYDRREPALESAKVQPDMATETAKPVHKHTPTILVADDSEINRAILTEILGQFGLLTVEASDGQEAVDIIREWDISLVLMDLEMPVMDGKEATAQIRGMGKLPQDVPILAMTAHTGDSLRMDCLSLGMNGYLTKPVDLQELTAALQRWLPGGLKDITGDSAIQQDSGGKERGQDVPINIDAGLATTGGNKKLYYSLLNRFVEGYGQGMSLLRELLEKESYIEAARLAHTIKGVAANLGMKRITELTKSIESCLPEIMPSETLLGQFEEAMRETIEYINGLQVESGAALVGNKELMDEDRAALRAVLENLPQKVERDWGGMQRTLEKFVASSENTPIAGKLAVLMRAIDDFDLESIARKSADLQQSLAAGG